MTLANKLTCARVALVPLMAVAYYLPLTWARWLAAGIFILAAVTDLIDGRLARKMNQVTTFGKFMDPIADKLLVMTMFILLCGDGLLHPGIVAAFAAREFVVSGVRLVCASSGQVVAASWLGKLKTNCQIVAVVALLIGNFPFRLIGVPFDQIAVWVALAATVWSGADYVIKNRAALLQSK